MAFNKKKNYYIFGLIFAFEQKKNANNFGSDILLEII